MIQGPTIKTPLYRINCLQTVWIELKWFNYMEQFQLTIRRPFFSEYLNLLFLVKEEMRTIFFLWGESGIPKAQIGSCH